MDEKESEMTEVNSLEVGDFLTGFRTGAPNENIIISKENLESQFTSSSWVRAVFDLTQAEVRGLNTDNGGYGYKLFEAEGSGKIIQIANPVVRFDNQVGAGSPNDQNFEIYSADSGGTLFMLCNSSSGSAGINTVTDDVADNVYPLMPVNAHLNPQITFQILNDIIYFWSDVDIPTYLGTAKLILDYRVIDFN